MFLEAGCQQVRHVAPVGKGKIVTVVAVVNTFIIDTVR